MALRKHKLMSELSNCPICKSENHKLIQGYENFHLSKCLECTMVFAKKIPGSDELESHYDQYSRDDYLSPVTIKRYHELLDTFEKYRKTGKILDVGCGIGYFLEEAKNRGWDVHGTEFTSDAVNICRDKGISMTEGVLNVGYYKLEDFDVLTSFEVIEHIHNPLEEIHKFNQLLRKGGLLYVTTPNFNSFLRYLLKSKYNVISFPEHLLYFTKTTLSMALHESNFKILKMSASGLSISRAKESLKIKTDKPIKIGSDDEKIRALTDGNIVGKIVFRILNTVLNLTGLGDALKSFSIKL